MKMHIAGREFLIVNRKKSGKKSDVFLLQVTSDGQRKYISSLWQINGTTYAFEYNGVRYVLDTEKRRIDRQG